MERPSTRMALAAVLADSLTVLASPWVSLWLMRRLVSPGAGSGLLVSGLYLAYCLAVYRLRRSDPNGPMASPGPLPAVLALVVGAFSLVLVAAAFGLDPAEVLDYDLTAPGTALTTIAAIAGSLMLALLNAYVLVAPIHRRTEPGGRASSVALDAVLLAMGDHLYLMALGAVALVVAGTQLVGLPAPVEFVPVGALLAALFSVPRALLARGNNPVPLVTFMAMSLGLLVVLGRLL